MQLRNLFAGRKGKLTAFLRSQSVGNCVVAMAILGVGTFLFGCSATDLLSDVQNRVQTAETATYSVTYSGNGNLMGSVPVDSTSYLEGQFVTVPGNPGNLTKTGYAFVGWNTQSDGSGTNYSQYQTFAIGGANLTLYARWLPIGSTFTVTYNGNGSTSGTVPIDSTNYVLNQSVIVAGNNGNLTRTGYTFTGWQVNLNPPTLLGGNTFQMGSASVTLYAIWTSAQTYTVTYYSNWGGGPHRTGTVPIDTTNYVPTQSVTVQGNTGNLRWTHPNHTFSGWNTQANGSGTTYQGGNTFPMGSANVNLYAKWN